MKLSELIRYATAGNNRDYYLCVDVDPLIEAKDKEIERLKGEHISNCLFHRCEKHRAVPQLNTNEFSGAECGGCILQTKLDGKVHLSEDLLKRISELEAENASLKSQLRTQVESKRL